MTVEQTQTLRQTVLNFLAIRHTGAFSPVDVANRIRAERMVDFRFADDAVCEACDVLAKLGLLQEVRETEFAVVKCFQATGKGVIDSERWRAERGLP